MLVRVIACRDTLWLEAMSKVCRKGALKFLAEVGQISCISPTASRRVSGRAGLMTAGVCGIKGRSLPSFSSRRTRESGFGPPITCAWMPAKYAVGTNSDVERIMVELSPR
jgi:hypothetical protein